jgi:hypothetical protein
MPKTKPKPPKRTTPPKKAAPKPRPKRMRAHKAVHPKPIKKARPTMTAATAKDESPRGAGSGEHANATRDRDETKGKHKATKTTEYPEGDIEKGRIDPEELTEGQTAEQIAMRDRRAYLLDQAEKNQAANDELNAIQVEQNKRVQLGQNILQDPDEMRESSMETAINALKQHDPDERKKNAEAAQKNAEKSPRYNPNPGTPDFKQGQASG